MEELAARQSEVLANKLGEGAREIPTRSLPYGSEGVVSPTYVPQLPGATAKDESTTPRTVTEPSYHGPSAQFEKGETYPTHETPLPPSEEEKDVLET